MRLPRLILKLCPAVAVVLVAAPLWAQEAEKAGLPPLNTKFYPGQIFWLAVTFTVLYVLMARFALPGVERTQEKRRAIVAAELQAANAANETAKTTIAEYEKILADARTKSINAEDTSKATKETVERVAAQQKELTKTMQQAETRITAARDAALREAQTAAAELARAVIEKITGTKIQVKA